MLYRLFGRRIAQPSALFGGPYMESRVLYAQEFDAPPSIAFINNIDTAKAHAFILDRLGIFIETTYEYNVFDHETGSMSYVTTIMILCDRRMIELGTNYCEVLHDPDQRQWANSLIMSLSAYRIINTAAPIGFARQAAEN